MKHKNTTYTIRPKKSQCEKTGKTKYPTQEKARIVMMRVISHTTTNMFDLHTYKCNHCGQWHFGHKSYWEKEQQKLKVEAKVFAN